MSLETKSWRNWKNWLRTWRLQIARNPNHTAMEKVELEDVQSWLRLRGKEAVGSPSNDIAF